MKKIAVVEDNPDNRLLVRVILESLYEVVEYETGFAALEGLPKEKPDLVLLDISLPELDGGEVLRRMRADAALRQLPVIALTAHAMAGDREKYLAAGFNDYVSKPIVEEQVLLDAIRKHLPEEAVTTSTTPAIQHLDEAAMDRLRRLGGDQFAGQMIGLFLDYAQTKLADAQRATLAGDCAGVAKAVHPIKSSAGNVGANRVQELAACLEETASGQQLGEVKRLLSDLEIALAEVKPRLEEEKKRLERAA
jgi:CheY-like chemotaxis protein/HPt (histidine-containing phosphotransfer) domain-containing protein